MEPTISDLPFPLEEYLVPRRWHRPYAKVLLEIDPNKRLELIAEAKRAVMARSVEIQTLPAPVEESRDLQAAVYVLSQLK
jgi:hypothetical protein